MNEQRAGVRDLEGNDKKTSVLYLDKEGVKEIKEGKGTGIL